MKTFTLLIVASLAFADPPKAPPKAPTTAPKGIWRVLVRSNARWVLPNSFDKEHDSVVEETYDVRKVGGADVARLRWTHVWGKGERERSDLGGSDGHVTQVAVTDAGLYLLDAQLDDAAVAKALEKKPARSDPPRPYEGTRQNHGRYLHIEEGPRVCMGAGPLPGAGDCEDVCFGELCISPTEGVVSLDGTWAPNNGSYARKGATGGKKLGKP